MADPSAPPSSRSLAEPLLNNDHDGDETSRELDSSSAAAAAASSSPRSPSRRNIKLILIYTLLMFGGRSMWSQTVLSAFVYLLRNQDPESVGTLTAVMGLSQLLFSFPAGILADRFRRDRLLKVSSIIGIVAMSTTIAALQRRSYRLLASALAVWGGFWGVAYTCISALFADSIRDGDRSYWFTQRMILIKVGNMAGPIAALAMFSVLGDEWSLDECSFVMTCGQALCAIPLVLLCFVSDDNAVQPTLSDSESDASDDRNRQPASQPPRSCFCLSRERYIPAMVAGADILSGIAAGMSIRYFPIFFLSNMELGPVVVQVLFILSVAFQIPISIVAQKGAKRLGRCQVTVVFKWMGIALFISMIVSYQLGLPAAATCIFWIGRTSCMNGTSALTKSIIMDEVPKKERAKWAALESVNMFSWSGSAFLGGVLVKRDGIIFNFCVTTACQLVATIPLLALFGKVRDEGATAAHQVVVSEPRHELQCEEAPEVSESWHDLQREEATEDRSRNS